MNEKHRRQLDPAPEAGNDDSATAGNGGGGLSQKKTELDAMLASADDAIEEALSQDSETFLAAHRQQGGQ